MTTHQGTPRTGLRRPRFWLPITTTTTPAAAIAAILIAVTLKGGAARPPARRRRSRNVMIEPATATMAIMRIQPRVGLTLALVIPSITLLEIGIVPPEP